MNAFDLRRSLAQNGGIPQTWRMHSCMPRRDSSRRPARKVNRLPQFGRLLAFTHHSRLDQLEAAFLALGKRLAFHLEDAA